MPVIIRSDKVKFSGPIRIHYTPYIRSSDKIISDGFQVGAPTTKDMQLSGGFSYVSSGTPNLSSVTLNASYWFDWGEDIFDNWGYFYLYDPQSNNYLGLQFSQRNQLDGLLSTEIFNFNGRTFTIKHGFPVQGIYKFDISVNDDLFFVFGEAGNMGSDSSTSNTNLTQSYVISGFNLNLYYNYNFQIGIPTEAFYSYFVPYIPDQNNSKTYNDYLSGSDNLYLWSNQVKRGLTVYHSKRFDVKNWIISDLVYQ